MNREQRLKEIIRKADLRLYNGEDLAFVIEEIKRLEAEKRQLLKDEGSACNRGNRLAQQCNDLQKENAEYKRFYEGSNRTTDLLRKDIRNTEAALDKQLRLHYNEIEALQKENAELRERYKKHFVLATNSLTQLQSKLDVVVKALEFYRDENNWVKKPSLPCSSIVADTGTRAKNALAAIGKDPHEKDCSK